MRKPPSLAESKGFPDLLSVFADKTEALRKIIIPIWGLIFGAGYLIWHLAQFESQYEYERHDGTPALREYIKESQKTTSEIRNVISDIKSHNDKMDVLIQQGADRQKLLEQKVLFSK